MSGSALLALLAGVVLVGWAVGAYNRLVALRNAIGEAWTQLEEPVRRRHDLIAELVAPLRDELPAEQAALDAALAAATQLQAACLAVRARPGEALAMGSVRLAEPVLAAALARLAALVGQQPGEAAPQLAAQRAELAALEARLVFRRQLYNQAAHAYNDALRQFPTSLLRPVFRFAPAGTL